MKYKVKYKGHVVAEFLFRLDATVFIEKKKETTIFPFLYTLHDEDDVVVNLDLV
jgi:hypothetical protein